MAETIEYIVKQEKFLKQFDSFVPKNATEEQIKKVLDDYRRSLDRLIADKDALFAVLNVDDGAISKTKKVRNENYPSEIRTLHQSIALSTGIGILAATYISLSTFFGGTNTDAWSTTLQLITITTGLVPAVPVTIASSVLLKSHYNKDTVLTKKVSLERMVLNMVARRLLRKAEKEAQVARLAINMKSNFEEILNGKYKLKEESINSLTRSQKRKVRKLLKRLGESKNNIDESFNTLKDMKEAQKERKATKKPPVRKVVEEVMEEPVITEEIEEVIVKKETTKKVDNKSRGRR